MLEKTKQLFDKLSALSRDLNGFILVGGTALSIRERHRLSEDLDFFSIADKLDRKRIERLIERLKEDGATVQKLEDVKTAQDFINAGDDIDDYQQNYLVDGVKLTFFHPFGAMEKPFEGERCYTEISGIKVAITENLFESKALLIDERTKIRDHYDLYWLCKNRGKTFADIMNVYQKYKNHISSDLVERKLIHPIFKDDDEPIEGMIAEKVTDKEISAYFAEQIHEHQIQIAAEIFEEGGPGY